MGAGSNKHVVGLDAVIRLFSSSCPIVVKHCSISLVEGLLNWQWSGRQSLTPPTKRVRHKRSLLKGVAVHRVPCKGILNAKLTGRKKLGRKRCTSNRDDRKLENTIKQSWFKHLRELHKEWIEAGASRVTTLRHLQEKGYQATSETESTSEASYLD